MVVLQVAQHGHIISVCNPANFDAKQKAFYYVRTIEIPTPSWLAFDAKVFGAKIPEGGKLVLQERAYTSPIWYTPGE